MSKSPINFEPCDYATISYMSGNAISRCHVSKVLRGKCGFSHESISIIARCAGVAVGELIDYIEQIERTNDNGTIR